MKKILTSLLLALSTVAIVIALYYDTGTLWHNQYDDAYITYRCAVNLAEGYGLVFNAGDRTDAASSFLYTVVLAAAYRVGAHDLEKVSFLLNMLALGLIAVFVYLCAFRLSRNQWGSIILGLIAACHGFISGWAALGMDTVPYAALLCALVWATIEHRKTLSLVLVLAVVLMRPEGLMIVPLWWLATGAKNRSGLIVLAVIFVYYGARFSYYGALMPHALQAKQLLIYYHSQPLVILQTWKTFAIAAPIMAAVGTFMDKRCRWLGFYIVIAAIACLVGLSSDWCRYTAPLFPLMLICGAPVFRKWQFMPLICAVLIYQSYGSIQFMHYQAIKLAPVQEMRREAGEWLQAHADHSRPVLSGDIGAIAYFAPWFQFIDTIGLTSRDVLHAYQHGKNLDAIIAESKLRTGNSYTLTATERLSAMGNHRTSRNQFWYGENNSAKRTP